jgi:2-polyprenyl-3-methyl-5-hydroxy-6-metoxy-1,4-benzoquinol methylase
MTTSGIDRWIQEPLWSQGIQDLDAALLPDLANVAELASRIPLRIFGEILLDPGKWLPRAASYLPVMPSADVQMQWTGAAGADLLVQSVDFIRCLISAAATRRIPISECQSLDFGIGWGRLARLWLKYAPPTNLAGCDAWDHSLSLAKNCGLQNELRQSDPLLTTLPFDLGRFDIIWAFSVFTHLSPDAFPAVLLGISQMLTKDGVFVFTVRPHSFWDYLDQQMAGVASTEASLRQETADGARFVQHQQANPHYGDLSVSAAFLQERCRQAGLRIDSFDWSINDAYQFVVVASHI